jgi:hypothetical protein
MGASYDMRLKSAQEWGCPMPMLHKISIQRHKVISHLCPPPPPPPISLFLFVVLELVDRNKCAQPIEEIFPHSTPLPFVVGWIADYTELTYEIHKVSYSQLRH